MNQRQAGNILRRNAPKGEHPAFINQQEASWLKGMGGSGRPTKSGLRSYNSEASERFYQSMSKNNEDYGPRNEGGLGPDGRKDYRPDQGAFETRPDVIQARDRSGDGGSGGSGGSGGVGGSGSSGGGMETRNNTSSSVSEIDRPSHEFRQKVYDKSGEIMDRPYEKYEGERFADASADTTTAQQGVRDMQGVGRGEGGGYTSAGATAQNIQGATIDPISGQSFLTGTGVDQYMNPHTANVIKGMQDSAMNTMQRQRNALQSQHQMAGAGMGSRGAIENAVMASEVQRGLGQQVAGALEGSYAQAGKMKQADLDRKQQQDRYNQVAQSEEGRLQLAGADTGIRATDAGRQAGYQDAQMLSKVGADIEGRDQRQKDFDYDEYIEGRDWDKNNAMFASNVLSGAPVGTTTTQNNPQYRNRGGSRMGSALAGAGAGWLYGGPTGAVIGGGLGYLGNDMGGLA